MSDYRDMGLAEALEFYREVTAAGDAETLRHMCRTDRYFLLVSVLGVTHMANEWCYARCREVEAAPDGYLDLWSRGHYKSTIITVGGIVQAVLRDPEITACVLSYNVATAHKFVGSIKEALENPALTALFPDVLWPRPPKERWSVRYGLWVRRRGLAKEPTVMGSGLVDGMPTGMHFALRVYDDVVTLESVSTPEQIRKTTEAFSLSDALGTGDGQRVWMVGTRYHPQDTYAEALKRGTAVERRRPCVDASGEPLLLSREALAAKRRDMGPRVFAAQMMLEPSSDETAWFKAEWLQVYDEAPPPAQRMNIWILVDPAGGREKRGRKDETGDYTVMAVVGLCDDGNRYVLPGTLRDRLNLAERTAALFGLVRRWPTAQVGYEQYGMQADIEHIRSVMEREHYRFGITALGGNVAKAQRIARLVPDFERGRWWVPRRLAYARRDGTVGDWTHEFRQDEFSSYPVVAHDDMLDCLARVYDVAGVFPKAASARGGGAARTNNGWNPFEK